MKHKTKDVAKFNAKGNDEICIMQKLLDDDIEATKQNIQAEKIFIQKADEFIEGIKDGDFTFEFSNAQTNNPALNTLKGKFIDLEKVLSEKIAKNGVKLLDLLDAYSKHDFTQRLDDDAAVASHSNNLGNEISNMLKQNLSQAESLQQKSDLLSKAVDQITASAKKQASSLEESAA
ncbi:methyl-accepting chemotaxis protein, partial [Campylobacter sputorum subsp. sputorum]